MTQTRTARRIRPILRKVAEKTADNRGATAVEFALVAPVFLMFVLGLVDFGRVYWIKSTMQYAVEQTARYAMVNPTATNTTLTTYAVSQVNGLDPSGITFNAADSTVSGTAFKTITASYTYTFSIPFVTLADAVLSAKSSAPVVVPVTPHGHHS
ncbi:TadE/TadG family type IV pilus assembly protein [Varunaivibrio sulfuroxidans]|uniref:Flp pilus assembly protein TadG n=1 Tax=Varunaivibrio sulfuroxidans TaxID=1773489 RepID=A0A4R3JDD8_9PROT|nr:TadE/TadG family type IV pilus assembly protein [Varunaivibrio sulfuroxidans]TCS64018.1 Flp pilus assembly protein TadG [Varunaivibrio sulfuroxidans]WES31530.1 TadE/TadG family type IV pilus assembly protein [Varunaivibrio sulfuroxidans]